MSTIISPECQRIREAAFNPEKGHFEFQQHMTVCIECRQFFQKLNQYEQQIRQGRKEISIPDEIADCLELRLKNNQNLFDQKLFKALKCEAPDDLSGRIIQNSRQPRLPIVTLLVIVLLFGLYVFLTAS